MNITLVDHPLAAHRLAALRDHQTPTPAFRRALSELASMLVYEACRDLPVTEWTVTTPLGPAPARRLAQKPLLVPVIRAGLGMLQAALDLVPESDVGFIGARRNETTLQPDVYLDTVPPQLDDRPVLVLDPMLATGGSAVQALDLVSPSTPASITIVCVLAAPEGIETVMAAHPDTLIVTAAVDERLNERGYILPGLGDAGDRQFGDI